MAGLLLTEANPEGIPAETVAAMEPDDQREFMHEWFQSHFVDPADETPHDAEDGYIYVWGGPYDAADELTEAFGDIVPEPLLLEVIQQIEREGHEWAPSSFKQHLDRDPSDWEDIDGKDDEPSRRAQVLQAINVAEAALAKLEPKPATHGGMGHNKPPETVAVSLPLTTADFYQIKVEFAVIRMEIANPTPDQKQVEAAHRSLQSKAKTMVDWFAATEFGKSFNKTLGAAAAGALVTLITHALIGLNNVVQSVEHWLSFFGAPF